MSKIHSSLFNELSIKTLIEADYETTHTEMLNRTLERIELKRQNIVTPDELWVVEHSDVYTLGQASKEEHILERGNTPIIQTDRGGQVTWHGRGQLVVYWLFDLNTLGWTVRNLVSHAEQSIEDVINNALSHIQTVNDGLIDNITSDNITAATDDNISFNTGIKQAKPQFYAQSRKDAPGVYIYNNNDLMLGKIASLGFKIKHGFSYHGVAINLNCDLTAFNSINPCGYKGMQMLRLADFVSLRATSDNGLSNDNDIDNIKESLATLNFTKQLLKNIKLRQMGEIVLRDTPKKTPKKITS